MARCAAIKPNGERCQKLADGQQDFCWSHSPAHASERRRTASKGGRGKASRELAGLKAQLQDLTREVLGGGLETGRAAVANQLINTRLRAIELERRIKETEELEDRLAALEREEGGQKWGA